MAAALARAVSIADLREIARRRLPRSVFEFIDGGAEDETTLRDNRAAFERIRLVPRVLRDVSDPQPGITLLGRPIAAPLLVAPMGCSMLAWPEADLAIARAAASLKLPYTMSTMSPVAIETMAERAGGDLWFQLYVLKNRGFNDRLVDRAWAAGFRTLVVTLDLATGGRRERDLRNGLSVPLRLGWRQVLDGLAHPHWALQMMASGLPQFENVRGAMADAGAGLSIAARVGQSLDAAWSWDDLARLRERWPGTLVAKGVLHAGDAARLTARGADAVWVSNHGGRQLDGAPASLDALPAVAQAVAGRVPLLLDSGVRRGVDILKARQCGAQAVAVGRAALYGAAAGGEAGARRALQMLIDELRTAMMLSGTRRLDAVESNG